MTSLNKRLSKNGSSECLINDEITLNTEPEQMRSSNSVSSQTSNISVQNCKICLMPVEDDEIKKYCFCRGSTGVVHKLCQLNWIARSGKTECEICKCKFTLKKEYAINTKFIFLLIIAFSLVGASFVLIIYKYNNQLFLFIGIIALLFMGSLFNLCNKSNFYILKNIDLLEMEEDPNQNLNSDVGSYV